MEAESCNNHETIIAHLAEQIHKMRNELLCVICRDVLTEPAYLPCNHTFCHACILESHKVKKVCPLCKTNYQRRSVKKNLLLENVVSCYRAMHELLPGSANEQSSLSTSRSESRSSSTSSEIAELKRMLFEQEQAIAEIDALLADTDPSERSTKPAEGDIDHDDESKGTKRKDRAASSQATHDTTESKSKRARLSSSEDEKEDEKIDNKKGRSKGGKKKVTDSSEAQIPSSEQEPIQQPESTEDAKEEVDEDPADPQSNEDQRSKSKKPKARRTKSTKSSESDAPASTCTKFVFLGTGLDAQKTKKLRQLANRLGGKIVTEFKDDVSHIITPDENHTTRRTIKFLTGLLRGLWIVNFNWVTSSLEAGKFINEEPFEITSDTVGKGGPEKGRLNGGAQSLFEGYSFYLHGNFKAPPKEDLKSLIAASGGTFLTRFPQSPGAKKRGRKKKSAEAEEAATPSDNERTLVLCDVGCSSKQAQEAQEQCGGREPISVLWLLDSISHFSPQPTESYVLS